MKVLIFLAIIAVTAAARFRREHVTGRHNIRRHPFIVGGSVASEGQIPFQLSISTNTYSHFCGASIISETWALTAAHCIEDGDLEDGLAVRGGSILHASGGHLISVSNAILHPLYDDYTLEYDVALLELSTSISFDENMDKVELADSIPAAGTYSTTSGWGTLQSGATTIPANLHYVDVPIVDWDVCNAAYARFGGITDSMICAGRTGLDACQGDSGGPLVVTETNQLIGVVSWGYGCGFEGYPGVYADITNEDIRSFISENTGIEL